MKIELETETTPEGAKAVAVIGLAVYEEADGHTHIAAPFRISLTAKRFHVLLVHNIMKSLGPYLHKCKVQAVKEEKEEACNDEREGRD